MPDRMVRVSGHKKGHRRVLQATDALKAKLRYAGAFPSLADFVDLSITRRAPRIGILTQDIFGPVRNAGIGTAYMHAATFLAEQKLDVTIVYTQGRASHTQPIDYWIDFYKERGVAFVCAQDAPQTTAPTPALRWSFNGFMQLLAMDPFDIVHSSEGGASPYYALLGKRNRGLFAATQFCIKTSSPHLWSREGNESTIGLDNGPIIALAERYCVEQADLVIAPSQHMLNWMLEHNYTLPPRICVHPNIMPMSTLGAAAASGDPGQAASGSVPASRQVDEIVFFGRLEPRKGIRLFSDAMIQALPQMSRKPKVTFLGKLRTDEVDFNFETFMSEFQEQTGLTPTVILDKDAAQAIAYLKEGRRVAVIPSLLDNSPFTVYEALANRFPFIASNVGGIPELVHPDDRARVLFAPRPNALAAMLARLVADGIALARLSFDPVDSLAVWDRFHRAPAAAPPPPSARPVERAEESCFALAVDEAQPLPVSLDDMEDLLERRSEPFFLLHVRGFELAAADFAAAIRSMRAAGADCAIPSTRHRQAGVETLHVNFQPTMWSKIDFSRLPTPAVIVRRAALSQALALFRQQSAMIATNIDEVVAAVAKNEGVVHVFPDLFGAYEGTSRWHFSRVLRNRQVRLLASRLPADIANMFRVYCGLQDERSRLVSAQPVITGIRRLFRILDRVRSEG